jgi:heterodisulfide reductase subunit A
MKANHQHIIIIGGGPAGLEAASNLDASGFRITLIEKEEHTGGKLRSWYKLFPGFRPSDEVQNYLADGMKMNSHLLLTNTEVISVTHGNEQHTVIFADGQSIKGDVVLIATGFQFFNAAKKEEYGYRIYDNVITSPDLEELLKTGKPLKTTAGRTPRRFAFIHCVGSRDKKVGNIQCSRVCCITGVKQAIEIKQLLPEAEIFNFYMDMRMFGQNFEELYIEAQQEWGVTFIRGRVSEIGENMDGTLQLKAEDTLSGRPMKMNFDLVVLLVGMVPTKNTGAIGKSAGLSFSSGGFLAGSDVHTCPNETNTPGIFITGTCREPLSIAETLTDARAASVSIINYLRKNEKNRS